MPVQTLPDGTQVDVPQAFLDSMAAPPPGGGGAVARSGAPHKAPRAQHRSHVVHTYLRSGPLGLPWPLWIIVAFTGLHVLATHDGFHGFRHGLKGHPTSPRRR